MECEHDAERIGFEEIDLLAMIIGKKDVDVDFVVDVVVFFAEVVVFENRQLNQDRWNWSAYSQKKHSQNSIIGMQHIP